MKLQAGHNAGAGRCVSQERLSPLLLYMVESHVSASKVAKEDKRQPCSVSNVYLNQIGKRLSIPHQRIDPDLLRHLCCV